MKLSNGYHNQTCPSHYEGWELGVWQGKYQETEGLWLRWYDAVGNWIPTNKEQVKQERQRAERLAAKLLKLGIDPLEL